MRAILSHPYAGALYWWFAFNSGRYEGAFKGGSGG